MARRMGYRRCPGGDGYGPASAGPGRSHPVTGPRLVGPRRSRRCPGRARGRSGDRRGGRRRLPPGRPPPSRAAPLLCSARSGRTPRIPVPCHSSVGRRDQAVELASEWTKETADPDRPDVAGTAHRLGAGRWGHRWRRAITMPASRPAAGCVAGRGAARGMRAAPARWELRCVDPAEVGDRFQLRRRCADRRRRHLPRGRADRRGLHGLAAAVRHVGALPESYVDAALMMGNRRREVVHEKERRPRSALTRRAALQRQQSAQSRRRQRARAADAFFGAERRPACRRRRCCPRPGCRRRCGRPRMPARGCPRGRTSPCRSRPAPGRWPPSPPCTAAARRLRAARCARRIRPHRSCRGGRLP